MKKLLLAISLFFSFTIFGQTVNIKINDSITYQEIFGFGGHGGLDNDAFITKLINDLGITVNRQEYNFGLTESNWNTKMKPYLSHLKAKADSSNEPLNFFFSTWTPNAAWKKNNSVCDTTCSSACNNVFRLDANGKEIPCNGTTNYLLPEYYDDFATTVAAFMKKVKTDVGIDVYGYSIQNEAAFNEPYVSCKYTPAQYGEVLKITKAEFAKQGLTTKFLGAEDMGSAPKLVTWTADSNIAKHLDIFAVHGYTDGINPGTGDPSGWTSMYNNASSKGKMLWMTETSGYTETWPSPLSLGKDIYMALKFGKINMWTWWMLNGPTNKINEALAVNGVVTKRYYISKNYYRYIRPGALQIFSSSSDANVYVVAFKNGGNSAYSAVKPQFTVILINNSTSSKTVNMSGRGLPATMKAYRTSSTEDCIALPDASISNVSLPAQSITTLVYQSSNKAPGFTQPEDVVVVKTNSAIAIPLTNITAGNGETQTLTVTAVSENKTLIPGAITITGSSPNYTLSFNTATNATGTAVIKVYIKDNGSTDILNTSVISVNVKVLPFINHAPTVNPISDYVCGMNNSSKKHYINFSGVTDGDDLSQTIYKPVITLSDPSIIKLPYINYTSLNATGNMEFFPAKVGQTMVTLTFQDNGGTDLSGNDTKQVTFKITVNENAPYVELGENSVQNLIVYPNPASSKITVELPDDSFSTIETVDITGNKVKQTAVRSSTTDIDISDLSSGMYIIIAKGKQGMAMTRITITK